MICLPTPNLTMPQAQDLISAVEDIRADPESAKKNRVGVLLGNKKFEKTTQTLTHTLWALFNVLPPHTVQVRAVKTHRSHVPHNLARHCVRCSATMYVSIRFDAYGIHPDRSSACTRCSLDYPQ